jgi:hypothetical protein
MEGEDAPTLTLVRRTNERDGFAAKEVQYLQGKADFKHSMARPAVYTTDEASSRQYALIGQDLDCSGACFPLHSTFLRVSSM